MRILQSFLAALVLTLVLAFGAAHATPATDAAKARCLIGERNDGYLGVVDGESPPAQAVRDMREINLRRASAYDDLAARNGVTRAQAARATAERLINQAPSGHCVQDASGAWIEKP